MRHALLSVVLIGGGFSSPAVAQSSRQGDDSALDGRLELNRRTDCPSGNSDQEIVVCGKHTDRFRIPRDLRSRATSSTSIRPRVPLTAGDLAPCGIFQGQRRCGRNEAAQYGYGEGRDPITVALKVIDALGDGEK